MANADLRAVTAAAIEKGSPLAIGVLGRGGSGKSELLNALADAELAVVFRCAGRRLEADVPFGAVEDLFDGDELELIEQATGTAAVTKARRILSTKLKGSLLIVDDAQWLDPESLLLLTALAGRVTQSEIRMVVAHRPSTDLGALDEALARSSPLIILEPLDGIATAERLVGHLGSEPSPGLVEHVQTATGGVPRFLDRLVEGWLASGEIEDGVLVGEGDLPSQLVESVRSRVGQLDASARGLIEAIALGASTNDEYLSELLEIPAGEVGSAIAELDAAGFLTVTATDVLPIVGDAIAALTPAPTQRHFHLRFGEVLDERGGSAVMIAEHLVQAGVGDKALMPRLVAAGDEVLVESPELASDWYMQAMRAGADELAMAPRRAEAALWAGDPERALRLADPLLESDAPERVRGLAVVAGALTARGLLHQAAKVNLRLAELSDDHGQVLYLFRAVPGLFAEGDIVTARKVHAQAELLMPQAPGLSIQAAHLVSVGLLAGVDGQVTSALRSLSSAAEIIESAPADRSLGDTPHALAAALACLAGEYEIADSLLSRAIENEIGGPAVRYRHRLLRGFAQMASGDWSGVAQLLDQMQPALLATRDELIYRALQVGLARRISDISGLRGCWREAHDVMMRHPVDLFALAPLGELLVAGARLGDVERLAPWGRARNELLDALGNPVLWKIHACWVDIQAAAACDDPLKTQEAASALASLSAPTARLEVLADAAEVWGQVLANEVDVARVDGVANQLHDAGFRWEAARLVGMAALRSTEESGVKALLAKARELRRSLAVKTIEESAVTAVLSEREMEVAAGLVDGHTYKEIGAILFISPKTVEHHVAKIRQRIGAQSRAELLATLRTELRPN